MFVIQLFAVKAVSALIKLIDKTRGTDMPGRIALKLNKSFYKGFKGFDPERVIIITGSNGKSTTTNLLYHVLTKNGFKVAANLKGSNMLNGAVSVFIKNCTLFGRLNADYYLIEADERSFPNIYRAFPARNVVVTNIMQDQVHRNGEPDFIYRLLHQAFNSDMRLYLNNHEPRSKSYEDISADVYYFGVDKTASAYKKDGPYDVTMPCPKCHGKIEFDYMNLANMGQFRCDDCGFASQTENTTTVTDANFAAGTFFIDGVRYSMPYTAPVMLYNYAAVAAVCKNLGLSGEKIAAGIEGFVNVAGRMETIKYKNKNIHYIRMKQENPETLQGAVDAVAQDKGRKLFVIGLCTLDERRPQWVPHYTNTYYAWEVDFKPLLASNVEKVICFSEYVCYDTAARLLYEGAEPGSLEVINSDAPDEVMKVIEAAESENVYFITLMRVMEGFKAYIRKNS